MKGWATAGIVISQGIYTIDDMPHDTYSRLVKDRPSKQ